MSKTLDRTKDIFLDTMLLGNEILVKRIKTTSKTKITVVFAAYRNVERLRELLGDIFRQNFDDFEVIIVDDMSGSTIEEFISRNDNNKINYIKKQLGSNSSAKNCALDYAKGEYVVFVEEDVRLNSDYLATLYELAFTKQADVAILTRKDYPVILNGKVVSGIKYLEEEIIKLKSDLDYDLTSCLFKKKFLDVYNLRFQENMLSLENLYFKLKTFDIATKVASTSKVCYSEILEKSVRNEAMVDASTRRIMTAINKIEEFKEGKSYEKSLNLLCGYLLFDILRIHDDMEDEVELLNLIKTKKNYFELDSFINKTMIAMTPILFANRLNRKERG